MPSALIVQTEHDGPGGLAVDHLVRRGFDLHVVEVLGPGASHSDVEFPDPTGFDLVDGWLATCSPGFFAQRAVDPTEVRDGFARHGDTAARNLAAMLDRFLDEHAR